MFSVTFTFDHTGCHFVLNTDVGQRQAETEAYDCVVDLKGQLSK